jgi:hypothetical protein
MNPAQQDLISKTSKIARTFLDLQGQIQEIDTLYNGAPNYAALITDETIVEVPSIAQSGVTAAQIATGVYVIKTMRETLMNTDLPAIVVVANIG